MVNYFLCCQEQYGEEEDIWFSAYTHNGLYHINKRTRKIQRVAEFQNEKGYASMLYKAVTRVKDWLVFAPCAAEEIAVYNYKRNQMKKIPLRKLRDKDREKYCEDFKFWTAIPYHKYVYLFGLRYPAIIRLNPETGETDYYTEWVRELDLKIGKENVDFSIKKGEQGYCSGVVTRGSIAYLCLCMGTVLKFNLENYSAEFEAIEVENEGFIGIGDDGTNLWLIPSHCHNIVKWNPESDTVREITVPYRNKKFCPFQAPLFFGKTMYLLPYALKDVYKVDLEAETVKLDQELSDMLCIPTKDYSTGMILMLNPRIINNTLTYINNNDYSWHTYDLNTGTDRVVYWEAESIDKEYIKWNYLDNVFINGNILSEDSGIKLTDFLDHLQSDIFIRNVFVNEEQVGKQIYESNAGKLH